MLEMYIFMYEWNLGMCCVFVHLSVVEMYTYFHHVRDRDRDRHWDLDADEEVTFDINQLSRAKYVAEDSSSLVYR